MSKSDFVSVMNFEDDFVLVKPFGKVWHSARVLMAVEDHRCQGSNCF